MQFPLSPQILERHILFVKRALAHIIRVILSWFYHSFNPDKGLLGAELEIIPLSCDGVTTDLKVIM